MAATDTTTALPPITHEHWCQPTGDRTEIRIEQFLAYADDEKAGRSVPAKRVTRCIECGNARYDNP